MSRSFNNDRGFTLVELIMVIVIVGSLSSVAVPKFINLSEHANKAACAANRGAIASAMAMTYAYIVILDPSRADWLETATMTDVVDTMFATGHVPVCPLAGGNYTLFNGNVICSIHGS